MTVNTGATFEILWQPSAAELFHSIARAFVALKTISIETILFSVTDIGLESSITARK